MIKDQHTEYKELLEELRHRYRQKYDAVLDDEILYLVIRVNELQLDLRKEIKAIPKITFRKGIDYFWYGVGKTVGFLIFGVGLVVVAALGFDFTKSKENSSPPDNEKVRAQEKNSRKGDSTIHLPAEKRASRFKK